jgi:hypothetical protein
MASHDQKSRRRWFQFSVVELLILTALIAVVWFASARLPIHDTTRVTPLDGSGLAATFEIGRPPTILETILRAIPASVATTSAWLAAILLVRRARGLSID